MDPHQRVAGLLLGALGLLGAVGLLASCAFVSVVLFNGDLGTFWLSLWGQPLLWVPFAAAAAYCLAALAAGLKAYHHAPSTRRWAIPVAAVSLVGFPLGTAFGVYAFWAFFRHDRQPHRPQWQVLADARRARA